MGSRCCWCFVNSVISLYYHSNYFTSNIFPATSLYEVMLSEVLQVLRGASKVGSALIATQGEQLSLITCNSSLAPVVKVAQDVVEGVVGSFMGSSNEVRLTDYVTFKCTLGHFHLVMGQLLVQPFCVCSSNQQKRTCFQMLKVGRTWTQMK